MGGEQLHKWLSEYHLERQIVRPDMQHVLAHEIRSDIISQGNESNMDFDGLSPIDQYVVGLKYCFGRGYLRFDTLDIDDETSAQLNAIKNYTSEGKVWALNNTTVALLTMDVTLNAKDAYYQILHRDGNEIVPKLLGRPSHSIQPNPILYVVNKDEVPYVPMDDRLDMICDFLMKTQLGNDDLTLAVSGWDLPNMDTPNEVICMLSHRFDRLTLYADSQKQDVRMISLC